MKKNLTLESLRAIVLIVLLAGAIGSLVMVLNAGRNNNSILLPVLFVTWVLSPFIALLIANMISKRWPVHTHAILYYLMLVVMLISLVGYSGAFSSPDTKPAFKFLLFPLISWLLIVIIIPITLRLSRKNGTALKSEKITKGWRSVWTHSSFLLLGWERIKRPLQEPRPLHVLKRPVQRVYLV